LFELPAVGFKVYKKVFYNNASFCLSFQQWDLKKLHTYHRITILFQFELPAVGFKDLYTFRYFDRRFMFELPAVGFKGIKKVTTKLFGNSLSFQQWDLKFSLLYTPL